MNNKKEYWQWKSTIIDFDTISDEKADFGDYITKKEMIFHYLGTPDKKIHEWYNGGWSSEYNEALRYAKELGLVEEYIDYDDIIYNLQSKIDKAIEYAKDNLPERDYMGCLLTDEDVTLNMILEKILDILKEDK